MKKSMLIGILLLVLGLVPACVNKSNAETIGVVDTARILTESLPGKAGEAHLQQVQAVLQKGFDDLQKMYKGKEKTTQAKSAIRDGYVALERQMATERQAVLQALGLVMDKAAKDWRAKNKSTLMVISKQMLLDADMAIDVTEGVMQEMNKQKAVFPALPTVQVNPPKKETPKPAAATPAKKR